MRRAWSRALTVFVAVLAFSSPALAAPLILDFEDLTPGEIVDGAYFFSQGLTFTGAIVLTDGDAIYPLSPGYTPVSGVDVVYNDSADIVITFATPIFSFSAQFMHSDVVTMTAYDAFDTLLAFAELVGSNVGGVHSPLEVEDPFDASSIYKVTLSAASFNSFILDDVRIFFEPEATPAPEPGAVTLLLAAGGAFAIRRRLARRSSSRRVS